MIILFRQKLHLLYCLACLLTFTVGCHDDDESVTPPPTDTPPADSTVAVNIKGHVQKGPFINGTAITLAELGSKLVATGKNFTTQIADNKGAFSLVDIPLTSSYVQLQANGFYYDEVQGEKSAAQLTLFALADVSNVSSVNVNLLSHLEKDRVIYLMQEEERSFSTAKQQAQQEILAIFGIEKADIATSELLDISQDGNDNAILLAISAILQGNNTVAELSELLANIITDIREDGVLNSESTKEKIRINAMSLVLVDIRQHLEARYEELGVNATIPNFEQYVDSDGDEFLNKDEDDTPDDFAFETQVNVAVDTTVVSNEVIVAGLKEGGKAIAYVKYDVPANGDSMHHYYDQGEARLIVNGQVQDKQEVQIANGDRVQVSLQSSYNFSTATMATLTIGSIVRTFEVTTDDYSPNPFSFKEIVNAPLETAYLSDTITVSGLPYSLPQHHIIFSTSYEMGDNDPGGRLREITMYVNNVPYTVYEGGSLSVPLSSGDQVCIRATSGYSYSSTVTATLAINDLSSSFKIRTTPNPMQQLSAFPGEASGRRACFSINEYMYVGTGYSYTGGNTGTSSDFYRFNTTTNTWTKMSDFPGKSRAFATAFVILGKGYLGLGVDESGNELNDFWVYDPVLDSWQESSIFPGEARANASSFVVGDSGYVGLGAKSDTYYGETFLKDFWKFDSSTKMWTQIRDFAGEARVYAFTFSITSKGFIGAGYTEGSNAYDFWEYDPNNNQWTEKAKLSFASEENVGFSIQNNGYAAFGTLEAMYTYNTTKDEWSAIEMNHNFSGVPDIGLSIGEKGYILDIENNFYEFTPPQD